MHNELNLSQKLDFGKIIEWTFKLIGKNFLFILKPMSYFLIPGIILVTVIGFLGYGVIEDFFNLMGNVTSMEYGGDYDAYTSAMLSNMIKLYGLIFGIFFLYSFFIIAANGACVKAIGAVLTNSGETTSDIVKDTLAKLASLIFTSLICTLMVIPAFLCCYIPGLILLVYLVFIPHVIMLENTHFFKAIGRSFSLVKNNFWFTVLILVVFYLMYSFTASAVITPFYAIPYTKMITAMLQSGGELDPSILQDMMKNYAPLLVIVMAISVLLSIFYYMINNMAITLKYYNIKNLREGTQILDELDQQSQTTTDSGPVENEGDNSEPQ